jgi:hypothetical protein
MYTYLANYALNLLLCGLLNLWGGNDHLDDICRYNE